MKKKLIFKKQHLVLLGVGFLLFILCNAQIFSFFPFGVGLAFSLIYLEYYPIAIIVGYFASCIIFNFSFISLVNSAFACALMLILFIILKTIKKKNLVLLFLFCSFSKLSSIYFSFSSISLLTISLIDLLVSLAFCFVYYKVINVLKFRGVQGFTTLETYYFYACVVVVCCGLCNVELGIINISKLIFVTAVLILSGVLKAKTMFLACFIAIANLLTGMQLYSCLQYFIFASIGGWLTSKNKFISASVVCLADSLMGLSATANYFINLIPILIASIIFICVPQKLINQIYIYVCGAKTNMASLYYVNKKQEIVKSKLNQIGSLFKQLQKCYENLVIGEADINNICAIKATRLETDVCEKCINKISCNHKNLTPCFKELLERAIARGKVSLLDVPPLLASNCVKVNSCLSYINQVAIECQESNQTIKAKDNNNLNISLQLGETSKIFNELSGQFACADKINTKKSLLIKENLIIQGVVCKECIATENYDGVAQIILIIRNSDAIKTEIIAACKKVYNINFQQSLVTATKVAGWSLVVVVPSSRYELICGCASTPKTENSKNGDNYVYTKLSNSKFLIAICDGMGHGENANNISSLAINLIESYYKCGLGSSVILQSVNNLLLPASDKGFTTLDATIVDTISGEVDFIKIGSTISVVKKTDTSEIVSVESLPLGVLDSVAPSTFKQVLFAGDCVVMVSDGVADVFASDQDFCNYVNNENIINMQMFAESILEEAMARQPNRKDDMTVIAYRLVQKR